MVDHLFLALILLIATHAHAFLGNVTDQPSNGTASTNSSTNGTLVSRTQMAPSLTATLTVSETFTSTMPFSGGFLAWYLESSGAHVTSFEMQSFLAEVLTKQSISLDIQLLGDAFDVVYLQANPEEAFKLLNVTRVSPNVVQARGIIEQSSVGSVLTASSLTWINSTLVRITFFQDAFVQVTQTEVIALSFLANATVSRMPPKNSLLISFNVTTYPANAALFGALGAFTASSAILFLVLGMPGTHQLQEVAMIGGMNCVDASVQEFTSGGHYFLVPVALDLSAAGRLISALIITGYTMLLHTVSCRVIRRYVPGISAPEVMSRTRYPSIPYGVLVLFYPGVVFFVVDFFYEVINGGLTVLLVAAVAIFGVTAVALVHLMFRSKSFGARRFISHEPQRPSSLISRLFRAVGQWEPEEVIRQYRTVIAPVTADSEKFTLFLFVESGIVAVVTAYQSYSQSSCNAQFAILALFNIFCGIVYTFKAPFRYSMDNLISSATCVLLCVMTLSSAVTNSSSPLIVAYKTAIALILVAVACRIGFAIRIAISEKPPSTRGTSFSSTMSPKHPSSLKSSVGVLELPTQTEAESCATNTCASSAPPPTPRKRKPKSKASSSPRKGKAEVV